MIAEIVYCKDRLPRSESRDDSCMPYYFIGTEGFGLATAMFLDGEWYSSYSSKIICDVIYWIELK